MALNASNLEYINKRGQKALGRIVKRGLNDFPQRGVFEKNMDSGKSAVDELAMLRGVNAGDERPASKGELHRIRQQIVAVHSIYA